MEKYLPVCHSLLGVIFAQINWTDWILQFSGSTGSVKNKCSAVLLNLTVHLATDIVAREVNLAKNKRINSEDLSFFSLRHGQALCILSKI